MTVKLNSGWSEAIATYLDFLAVEMLAAASTITAYESDLKQIAKFMETKKTGPFDVTLKSAAEFFFSLESLGYKPVTVHRKYHAFRSFLNWAVETEIIYKNPLPNLGTIPEPACIRVLSDSEIGMILAACEKNRPTMRNLALVNLAVRHGLRGREISGLTFADLTVGEDGHHLTVGEERHRRTILLDEYTAECLRNYKLWEYTKMPGCSNAHQFIFINTKSFKGESLTRGGIWLILTKLIAEAGLVGVTTNNLYHTFIANSVRVNGINATRRLAGTIGSSRLIHEISAEISGKEK